MYQPFTNHSKDLRPILLWNQLLIPVKVIHCSVFLMNSSKKKIPSLKLTAKAPENGWLEYDCFLLGPGLFIFRGRLAVSFRGKISHIPQVDPWLKGKHTKKFIRKVSGKFYHRTERKPHPKEGEMILASYTWIFQICVSNLVPTFTPKNPTNLGRHFYISTRYTRWFSRRDLFVPDRWRVTVIAFQRVTFSPSQKGHKELLGGDHFISHEIRIPSWTKSIMECHKGFQIWWNMPKYIKYIIHILQILGQRFKASNI